MASVTSSSSGRPVRSTAPGPPGPSSATGQRSSYSQAKRTFSGSACATAARGSPFASAT
jgi:hypothetical protein